MSRSNPQETTKSPAQKKFTFNRATGKFQYWDKVSRENIEVKMPFRFVVLDTLATIGGYNQATKSGFWSNEVRNTTEDKLTVRTKDGIFAEGYYQEFVDKLKANGGKFVQSVYIAYKDADEELIIANVKFIGSNLSKWINFNKEHKAEVFKQAVIIRKSVEETNEANTYQVPVFALTEATDKSNAEATELDKKLQGLLDVYLKQPAPQKSQAMRPSEEFLEQPAVSSEVPVKEIAEDEMPY